MNLTKEQEDRIKLIVKICTKREWLKEDRNCIATIGLADLEKCLIMMVDDNYLKFMQ